MTRAGASQDLLLHNGRIITIESGDSQPTALAIRGERILAVGTDAELEGLLPPDAECIDLGGRAVTPGLIDTHAHLDREGLKERYPSLAGCRSVADILGVVRQLAANSAPGEWIVTMPVGSPPWFFDGPESLLEGRGPTRWELDTVAPRNPVYIRGPWGFWNRPPLSSFASSLALQRAGIDRETTAPTSTVEIERDPLTGEPTGAFREHYPIPVLELTLFRVVPRFTLADRVAGIRAGMRRYAAAGTTSIYEGHGVAPEVLSAYLQLWEAGEQTVRAYLVLSPTWRSPDEATLQLRETLGYASGRGFGDDLLRVGGLFVGLGGHPEVAACAREALPYTAWAGFLDAHREPEEYEVLANHVLDNGYRLNTIVSANLEPILQVLERRVARRPYSDRQVVLEHVRVATPDQIARMKRLGVYCTTQPSSYVWKEGAAAITAGAEPEHLVPHRALTLAGVPFALGTDNKPYQPLYTLWAAVARLPRGGIAPIGPGQALTRMEALRALTIDAAALSFEEGQKGSLRAGKLADLVVWESDPLSVPIEALPGIEAALTMTGGTIVHRSASF